MKRIYVFLLCLGACSLALAHGGRTDSNGGHHNRKIDDYHCHREPCYSNLKGSTQAYKEALQSQRPLFKVYSRKDWPHWVDADGDCQNTRAEVLIAHSTKPVKFKRNKGCSVTWGEWFGAYTGKTFTKASDVDIDHIVPLAHAHRIGAANWSRERKREFSNDPVNLLPVDDETNQAKSDKGPDQWKPPRKAYWCKYAKKWKAVKSKYGLESSHKEKTSLRNMMAACK